MLDQVNILRLGVYDVRAHVLKLLNVGINILRLGVYDAIAHVLKLLNVGINILRLGVYDVRAHVLKLRIKSTKCWYKYTSSGCL